MGINENQKIELFDKFYDWLKADGLKAKKSERLHRKKIFASLLANDEMTLDNFADFLQDYKKEQILVLKGKIIEINGLPCFIQDIKLETKLDAFTLITDNNIHLKCKTEDLTQIEKKILKEKI
ncbi:hypothetical protein [Arcobacter cloacae]|uniref:Uncharacterized protein n=1 Tax=Arcobacter cloacae TaxID=1054034 RepID=A0A6M8NJ44_9BACT|nr:hypothetical protein [Arcobacter cloacae]QKF90422.1 hypothetical protein ACLO_1941 [Arcobacter cloacae]QKF90489.1 hypothetical protein ACLO_2009 [Arcobacter cloacae]RXI36864.1 hypothetical protein CP963_13990 [Arcobacter cloacae]